MDGDLRVISDQLVGARPLFENRIQFSDALTQIAELFGYPAIYILGPSGEVLASGEAAGAPPYVAPPRAVLEAAVRGRAASAAGD
jgi:two-component system nitrogen regulation sensor histidine kinase NtrY